MVISDWIKSVLRAVSSKCNVYTHYVGWQQYAATESSIPHFFFVFMWGNCSHGSITIQIK